ncbi:MAG: methyltransferase domain-containing protein [Chloroflexota bacterium]
MNSDILTILRDPVTHDALEIKTESDVHGRPLEFLVNPRTGRRFPVRNGIPIFLLDGEVSGLNQRYQAMYDRSALFYDFSTWAYSLWKGVSVEARLREYLDELEIGEGDRVLEVSVGTGRNMRFLPRNAQISGLDISWGMLKQCQRNVSKWKLDVGLFMGTAERLPFQDEAFDVVFHFGGINFFNDKAAAICEMIRVAKPGTKFVIGDENEALAQKYENLPVTGDFYGNRKQAIAAPVDLLPPGMLDVRVKEIAGGDMYCLSFRKPGS